jgi:hypothetical protein
MKRGNFINGGSFTWILRQLLRFKIKELAIGSAYSKLPIDQKYRRNVDRANKHCCEIKIEENTFEQKVIGICSPSIRYSQRTQLHVQQSILVLLGVDLLPL